ncbi:MAG: hypothetical protein M1514_04130 [Patescibacteria group bacterium]|nr:hypothetical protein [Patescibacteria group bacterium]
MVEEKSINPSISSDKVKVFSVVIKIMIVLLALLGAIDGILLLIKKTKVEPLSLVTKTGLAAVSGIINLNGVVPSGATIEVAKRQVGENQYQIVASGLPAVDGASWSWSEAEPGIAYQFQAYLKAGEQTVSQSDPWIFVAPATNETLTINSAVSKENTLAVISGSLDINGYLPAKAKVSLLVRKTGEAQFNLVDSIQAIDGGIWSWNEAQKGSTYDLQASLVDKNGNLLGQSIIQTVTAPAFNEVIRLNSLAKPPAPVVGSISGKINFNGLVPANSSISVGQRPSGSGQFTNFANGLQVADGVVWSWDQAKHGASYDLQAYLLTNGIVVSQSQVVTVSAPAVGEVLTINAQNQSAAPKPNNLDYSCLGKNNNGLWQVRFNFNNSSLVTNAQQYWLTVGTSNQGSQMVNNVIASTSNPSHSQTYTSDYVFSENTTYYAAWAYSTCSSCQTFSLFSPTLSISCSPSSTPSNTPMPVPTNTTAPQPSSTPIPPTSAPLPTDTPLPTPKISQCNESCGSNGYLCVDGLQCLQEGGAIGGELCRNSACPEETNCQCPPTN